MAAYGIGQAIIISSCGFFFLLIFYRLFSAVGNSMSTILPHMVWPYSANLECRSEMCCTRLAGNTGCKNDEKNRHLRTIAQLCRAVSSQQGTHQQSGKNVKQQYLLHMSHNMANFGPLTAEICWWVLFTPANFNGFRVLPSLLQRNRSPRGGQPNFARCLAISWAGTLYIHFRGLLSPLTEFCPVQYSLYVQVLRSSILAALLHGTPAAGVSQTLWRGTGTELRKFRRGRHLYSAGRPSRWASAHSVVLVLFVLLPSLFRNVFYVKTTILHSFLQNDAIWNVLYMERCLLHLNINTVYKHFR